MEKNMTEFEFKKGNCYEAAFNSLFKNTKFNKEEWYLVHAVREHFAGTEWFGGHAFLYNPYAKNGKDGAGMIYSNANNDMSSNDGKPLEITFKEAVEKWSLKPHDETMFKMYTMKEAAAKAVEYEHYGAWDLPYELWADKEWFKTNTKFDTYGEYMKEHFIPKYQPKLEVMREIKKEIKETIK